MACQALLQLTLPQYMAQLARTQAVQSTISADVLDAQFVTWSSLPGVLLARFQSLS
jgi:hypothetical protein